MASYDLLKSGGADRRTDEPPHAAIADQPASHRCPLHQLPQEQEHAPARLVELECGARLHRSFEHAPQQVVNHIEAEFREVDAYLIGSSMDSGRSIGKMASAHGADQERPSRVEKLADEHP